jgi:hypothetical protein
MRNLNLPLAGEGRGKGKAKRAIFLVRGWPKGHGKFIEKLELQDENCKFQKKCPVFWILQFRFCILSRRES